MGENIDFQLGYNLEFSIAPKKVQIENKEINSIVCGLNHVIVTTKSLLYGWGSNRYGQLNPFSNEPYYQMIQLDYIRNSIVYMIKCSGLGTVVIHRKKIPDKLQKT